MRDRIEDPVVNENQQMLLSVVDQLVVIASVYGSNNLYGRIYVTTYVLIVHSGDIYETRYYINLLQLQVLGYEFRKQ